jgi:hypothetical protein
MSEVADLPSWTAPGRTMTSRVEGGEMRKLLSTAIVALVVFAGFTPATAATAGGTSRVRHYEGPTSEGGRLRMSVVVKDGVARLSLLLIQAPYRCEDGTDGTIDDGVGWFPKGPLISDAHVELSENWHSVAFTVTGRLGSHRGSGTMTFLMPGFTADGLGAQVCSTGELTWSVERTTGGDLAFRSPVTVEGGNALATGHGETRSDEVVLARAGAGPIRQYRGRTSQDHPGEGNHPFGMPARTQRTDSGIALLVLSFGFLLACDDGTEVQGSIRPTAFFDVAQVMPPGRLDLDLASSWGFQPVIVNLHGELDGHAGAGTLTMALPELTDDLDAQLCTTGDQTWEMWRTDAGY